MQSSLLEIRSDLVRSFDMDVPSALEVLFYLSTVVHVKGMINDRNVSIHRTIAVENGICIYCFLFYLIVSKTWKEILRKSVRENLSRISSRKCSSTVTQWSTKSLPSTTMGLFRMMNWTTLHERPSRSMCQLALMLTRGDGRLWNNCQCATSGIGCSSLS